MATLEMVGGDPTSHFNAERYVYATIRTASVPSDVPYERYFEIQCARGSMRFEFSTSMLTVQRMNLTSGAVETETIRGGFGSAFADVGTPAMGRAMLAVLRPDETDAKKPLSYAEPAEEGGILPGHLASLQDGLVAQRVTDAVHASALRHGAWVDPLDIRGERPDHNNDFNHPPPAFAK